MILKLISYDIENNAMRTKLAEKLLAWGFYRLQYSVFAGSITAFQWDKCWHYIQELSIGFNTETDKIMVINISKNEWKRMQKIGEIKNNDEILNEKNTFWM